MCLLNELGKLFGRVISDPICGYLSQVGPDLSDSQFGFRGDARQSLPRSRVAALPACRHRDLSVRQNVEVCRSERGVKSKGGVLQGSSGQGPLLWNLAYDAVLRNRLPSGLSVICYATDTLILAREGPTLRSYFYSHSRGWPVSWIRFVIWA